MSVDKIDGKDILWRQYWNPTEKEVYFGSTSLQAVLGEFLRQGVEIGWETKLLTEFMQQLQAMTVQIHKQNNTP